MERRVVDTLAEVQDRVLDDQHDWLMTFNESIRGDVFNHLCLVTGQLLNVLQAESLLVGE